MFKQNRSLCEFPLSRLNTQTICQIKSQNLVVLKKFVLSLRCSLILVTCELKALTPNFNQDLL